MWRTVLPHFTELRYKVVILPLIQLGHDGLAPYSGRHLPAGVSGYYGWMDGWMVPNNPKNLTVMLHLSFEDDAEVVAVLAWCSLLRSISSFLTTTPPPSTCGQRICLKMPRCPFHYHIQTNIPMSSSTGEAEQSGFSGLDHSAPSCAFIRMLCLTSALEAPSRAATASR